MRKILGIILISISLIVLLVMFIVISQGYYSEAGYEVYSLRDIITIRLSYHVHLKFYHEQIGQTPDPLGSPTPPNGDEFTTPQDAGAFKVTIFPVNMT